MFGRVSSQAFRVIDKLLSSALFGVCGLCGALSLSRLCERCMILPDWELACCRRCGGLSSVSVAQCFHCHWFRDFNVLQGKSSLVLTDNAKNLIRKIKFSHRPDLVHYLSELFRSLAQRIHFPEVDVVIPVPMHPKKFVSRGLDLSDCLASWVSESLSVRLLRGALVKSKMTVAQSSLTRSQRKENLRGSFSWRCDFMPQRVLLIDDIYTTGATIKSCAKILKRYGCRDIFFWTLFRTR